MLYYLLQVLIDETFPFLNICDYISIKIFKINVYILINFK